MKFDEDPGIAWIWKIPHEISAKFDHDQKSSVSITANWKKSTPTVL
jgi:hypothetical protein